MRTQHHHDYAELILAGADHVVPEMFEASLLITAEVMTFLGFSRGTVEEQIEKERKSQIKLPMNAS